MRMKWSPLIGSLQQWWLTDSVWLVCLSTPSWLLLSCLCQLLILLFLKHVSKLFMNFKSWCKIISVIKWQVVHIKAQVIILQNYCDSIWELGISDFWVLVKLGALIIVSKDAAFEIKCMLAIHLKNITFFYFQFATFATEIRGLEVVSP